MPKLAADLPDAQTVPAEVLVEAIAEMIADTDYPCLGARAVYRRDRATMRVYDELDTPATTQLLLHDLQEFASTVDLNKGFAYSIAGSPYFIVGMHPMASRDARRTAAPVLVFNPREQFEALRATGQFLRMRDLIRDRDLQLQGTVNPMVADHGTASEARQYSGREVSGSPADARSTTPTRCSSPPAMCSAATGAHRWRQSSKTPAGCTTSC